MLHAADKNVKNSLRKQDRLKSSFVINALYQENRFLLSFPLKCYYSLSDSVENKSKIQAAFAVPKKLFKRAVDRNTIKRRMRETYRLNYKKMFDQFSKQQTNQLKLFFIFVGKEKFEYRTIEKSMQELLLKISSKFISGF